MTSLRQLIDTPSLAEGPRRLSAREHNILLMARKGGRGRRLDAEAKRLALVKHQSDQHQLQRIIRVLGENVSYYRLCKSMGEEPPASLIETIGVLTEMKAEYETRLSVKEEAP